MNVVLTPSKNEKLILEEFYHNSQINTVVYRKLSYQNYDDNYVCTSKIKRVTNSPEAMGVDTIGELSNTNLRSRNRFTYKTKSKNIIKPVKKPKHRLSKILLALIFVIIGLLIYGVYNVAHDNPNLQTQIELIKNELQGSMLQQEEAVGVIVRSLEDLNIPTYVCKILVFVGTTGVGKTFALNIIKKHYPSHLIHEVVRKDFDRLENFYSISSSSCNLIFIDNLKAADLKDVLAFIQKLPTSQNLLIIPVINVHDTTDGLIYTVNKEDFKAVREGFDGLGMNFEIALFDELQRDVVENWLKDELRRKSISEDKHDLFVKLLLDDDHVKYKGLKGLNSKLLTDLSQ